MVQLDQGTLGLINNEIQQTTGTIQLKANFPNKAHKLWPGELSMRGSCSRHGTTG
jgi:multidrug efflux system membrane fusion protein